MVPVIFFNLSLFVACSFLPVYAQNNIQHGATGTLNHDYFDPNKDGHMQWLVKDIEKHHLEPAKGSLRAGDYKRALVDLNYLLERLVNHPQGLLLIGAVARLTKRPALPLPYYERALRLYPQYAITHAQYGSYLLDSGNIKAGTERLKRAVALDPNLAVAHAWMAKAHLKSGNSELARQAAARARELGYKGQIR